MSMDERAGHTPENGTTLPVGIWRDDEVQSQHGSPAGQTPGATHPSSPPSSNQPTPQPSSELLFSAQQLQMKGRESMVFGPVDLDVPAGSTAVITGQQGSGRSAMLLALAGRLKGVEGSLTVGDIDGIAHPRKLRKQVSVARISGLADLEPNLTIGESRDERAIIEGIGTRRGRQRFSELESLLGHHFDTEQWIGRTPAVERTLLSIVLGCLSPARYVVVDDVDESLTDRQLGWIHDGIELLRPAGHHFVMTALDQSPLPPDAVVLHLEPPIARSEAGFELHLLRRTTARLRPATPAQTGPRQLTAGSSGSSRSLTTPDSSPQTATQPVDEEI